MNKNKYTILCIASEDAEHGRLSSLLKGEGYRVLLAKTKKNGKLMFASHHPNLILLYDSLSDGSGRNLVSEIREDSYTPILFLSDSPEETAVVDILDRGANDYITLPYRENELLARIRAALRSIQYSHTAANDGKPKESFARGEFRINYAARQVILREVPVPLTQTEYNIVALLAEHCGKVLSYSSICKTVWGYNDFGSTKKLQVNMANIRKKFDLCAPNSTIIVNRPGVGYLLPNDRAE